MWWTYTFGTNIAGIGIAAHEARILSYFLVFKFGDIWLSSPGVPGPSTCHFHLYECIHSGNAANIDGFLRIWYWLVFIVQHKLE